MLIRPMVSSARVLAVLLLMCLMCLAFHSVSAQDTKQEFEIWHGTIKTPNQWLRTTLYLRSNSDGSLTGYSVSNDQKSAKIPITNITRADGKWAVDFQSVNAKFVGNESEPGKSVDGVFTQNGTDFQLLLKRVSVLPPLIGQPVYRGELNAIVQKLPMQLRVIEGEKKDGHQLVLVDSLSEGFGSFVGTLESNDDQLVIKIPGLAATWKGKAKREDERWTGSWSQGLIPLPLEWKREASAKELDVVKKKRPQTPQPPFPYESSEVTIESGEGSQVTLSGTLLIPKSEKKLAAVILITGSGPQDRDETILDHKPFWVIADHFARQGIAVLRYDDRGVGKSTGNFESAVTDDFIVDAQAAWNFLAKQSQIDATKVGLLGHSEGSSVAISVAAKNPDVAFLVLMAGAGWDGRKIVVEQTLEMSRRQQASESTLTALRKLMEEHSDLVLRNPQQAEFEKELERIVIAFVDGAEVPADAKATSKAALLARLKQLNTPWYNDFLKRNPSQQLSMVKRPLLAVWGSEDVQVPATGNRDAMKSALDASSHKNSRLEILPGLNHLFQPCKTGLIDEYEAIETTISPQALNKFTDFILEATR